MGSEQLILGLSGPQLERLRAARGTLVNDWYVRWGVVRGQTVIVAGGCEQGLLSRLLGDGCSVTVVDRTDEGLRCARELADRPGADVRAAVSEPTELPFDNSTFERAVMLSVMHDLHDVAGAMAELARVMINGGRLLILDKTDLGHRPQSIEEELEALYCDARRARGEDPAGIMTPAGCQGVLQRAGWRIEAQRVWAPMATVEMPQALDVGDVSASIAGLEDETARNRLSERLERIVSRAGGRQAVAPRWAAIAVRDGENSETEQDNVSDS